jgi:hypothetical protein
MLQNVKKFMFPHTLKNGYRKRKGVVFKIHSLHKITPYPLNYNHYYICEVRWAKNEISSEIWNASSMHVNNL